MWVWGAMVFSLVGRGGEWPTDKQRERERWVRGPPDWRGEWIISSIKSKERGEEFSIEMDFPIFVYGVFLYRILSLIAGSDDALGCLNPLTREL